MKKILAVLVLAAGALHAQVSNPSIIQPPSSPAGNSCTNQLPLQVYQGVLYSCQSGVVTALGGSGTVTSVAMTMPGVLYNSSVTGSPITSSGTLTPALINQTAYSVFGNFTGSSATPAFSTTPIFGSSTFNAAGAASTPALSVTGAWYNSTSNVPQVYIDCSGATAPTFAASTYYGLVVNGCSSTEPFAVYQNGTADFSISNSTIVASLATSMNSFSDVVSGATIVPAIFKNTNASPTGDLSDWEITSSATKVLTIDHAGNLVSGGTQTVSGCSLSSAKGGQFAGSFQSGTAGTCTVTITPGSTAPNGWSCWASDLTTVADTVKQTAYNATTATIAGTTASSDLVTWGCVAF